MYVMLVCTGAYIHLNACMCLDSHVIMQYNI